jgi:predicted esterase YcpF (UPF0227 family)
MKPDSSQWFEQEPTESEMEYKTLGDEPIMLKAMNYIPRAINTNPDYNQVKLPGISLGKYYGKKK